MKTSFGRGTVYEPKKQKTLAEVYYFIQGTAPDEDDECQGFLEPVLEYESLFDALRGESDSLLELEDGSRISITTANPQAFASNMLPIFFHAVVKQDFSDSVLDLGA